MPVAAASGGDVGGDDGGDGNEGGEAAVAAVAAAADDEKSVLPPPPSASAPVDAIDAASGAAVPLPLGAVIGADRAVAAAQRQPTSAGTRRRKAASRAAAAIAGLFDSDAAAGHGATDDAAVAARDLPADVVSYIGASDGTAGADLRATVATGLAGTLTEQTPPPFLAPEHDDA